MFIVDLFFGQDHFHWREVFWNFTVDTVFIFIGKVFLNFTTLLISGNVFIFYFDKIVL